MPFTRGTASFLTRGLGTRRNEKSRMSGDHRPRHSMRLADETEDALENFAGLAIGAPTMPADDWGDVLPRIAVPIAAVRLTAGVQGAAGPVGRSEHPAGRQSPASRAAVPIRHCAPANAVTGGAAAQLMRG